MNAKISLARKEKPTPGEFGLGVGKSRVAFSIYWGTFKKSRQIAHYAQQSGLLNIYSQLSKGSPQSREGKNKNGQFFSLYRLLYLPA